MRRRCGSRCNTNRKNMSGFGGGSGQSDELAFVRLGEPDHPVTGLRNRSSGRLSFSAGPRNSGAGRLFGFVGLRGDAAWLE
jgi:hypothetical protein